MPKDPNAEQNFDRSAEMQEYLMFLILNPGRWGLLECRMPWMPKSAMNSADAGWSCVCVCVCVLQEIIWNYLIETA